MTTDVVDRLRALRVVPVVVIDDAERAAPLARALVDGGLPCAEVTFRTPAAALAIRRIADAYPQLLLGAGTVLRPEQVDAAVAAGASFIVAPGFNPRVVDRALDRQIPVFPGVCTPTEIEAALERGLRVVKFFPAEPMGGVRYLSAISAPYGEIGFIPTGGINAARLGEYLKLPAVVACGGSWMVARDLVGEGDFARVRGAVEEAVRTVHAIREGE